MSAAQAAGGSMADHSETTYSNAEGMDYPAHEDMYRFFVRLVTWGTVVVIAIVVLMAVFLL